MRSTVVPVLLGQLCLATACHSTKTTDRDTKTTATGPDLATAPVPAQATPGTPSAAQAVQAKAPTRIRHLLTPRLALGLDGLLHCRDAKTCGAVDGLKPTSMGRSMPVVEVSEPRVFLANLPLLPLPSAFSLPIQVTDNAGVGLQDRNGAVWSTQGCAQGEETVLSFHKWRGPMQAQPFRELTQGSRLGCGITQADQALQCWAYDSVPCAPKKIPLYGKPIAVVAGLEHVCAMTETGSVTCWGDASYGQTGFVGEKRADYEFSLVASMQRFVQLAPRKQFLTLSAPAREIYAAGNMSCAWLQNGEFWCWGDTWKLPFEKSRKEQHWQDRIAVGRDANRTTIYKPTFASTLPDSPLHMPNDCKITDVTVLDAQICVVCDSGCAQCWGFNVNDTLGYGDSNDRWEPTNGCLAF